MPIQAGVSSLATATATATTTAEELAALVAERDALDGALRVATTERDLALERLKSLQRQLFAAKSEARGTDQKDLFLNEAEALAPTDQMPPAVIDEEDSTPVAGHQRKKRGRKPLDPALPRQIVRHELPEAERVCAHDGHALVEIGAEVSEQMDVIPEQVRVLQHHRIKYACPCCDQSLKVAPTPARIIPRGLLTEAAQAWVITGKYQFGMPLYRTAALLRCFGGDIVSNTLTGGVVRIGRAVQPVVNLLRDHLLDSDLIYGDETTVQVLKEPGRKAQTKSYMWAQMNGTGPPVRLFAYAPRRGAVHAEKLYAGIRPGSTLMSDGYEVYNGIAKAGGLTHLGCWVHARQPFLKAEEAIPKAARSPSQIATRFVRLIAKLYRAEALAKEWTSARRLQLRSHYSAAVVRDIEQLLLMRLHAVAPSSLLGEALHYLHGQWPKLVRFLDNGTWPLDSNPVENAIRPFVVGRRSWLFADTVGGANASANLYSLIETAKANNIEPYRYLVALFKKLPLAQTVDDYEALLPWNSLSRTLIAAGVTCLVELGLIQTLGSHQKRRYLIVAKGTSGGWFKLPSAAIVRNQAIFPLANFTLRSKHELHALKLYLYLYLAARRTNSLEYTSVSYENIFERIGISEQDIRRAACSLINCGLLRNVERESDSARKH